MEKRVEVRAGGEIYCSEAQSLMRPCDVFYLIVRGKECDDCPIQDLICRYYNAAGMPREEDFASFGFISDWFLTDSDDGKEVDD